MRSKCKCNIFYAILSVIYLLYTIIIINSYRYNSLCRAQERIIQRRLRDASNAFELSNRTFLKLFRLDKHSVHYLITTIEPHIPENIRITRIIPLLFCCHHLFQIFGTEYREHVFYSSFSILKTP